MEAWFFQAGNLITKSYADSAQSGDTTAKTARKSLAELADQSRTYGRGDFPFRSIWAAPSSVLRKQVRPGRDQVLATIMDGWFFGAPTTRNLISDQASVGPTRVSRTLTGVSYTAITLLGVSDKSAAIITVTDQSVANVRSSDS